MSEIDEVVGEFLVESYEHLDRFDDDLLALERDPSDGEVLSRIFRTIHSIKGTCGFFGFAQLESVSHVAENLLGRLRNGELAVTNEITSALLATGDALRSLLAEIEATGEEGEGDHAESVAALSCLQAGTSAVAAGQAAAAAPESPEAGDGAHAVDMTSELAKPDGGVAPTRLGDLLIEQGLATPEDVALALRAQALGDRRLLGEILIDQSKVSEDEVDRRLATQAWARGLAESSVRVDVGWLDELMRLTEELVGVSDQVAQLAATRHDPAFADASQRLSQITAALQGSALQTRMQPIDSAWSKLPRLVRDLALACGKRVDLVLQGHGTELDKTIVEAIKDPLTHLVRNAVDHGIEAPSRRAADGKPETGQLRLRAFHDGARVTIEVADDGAGIDTTRLKATARANGMITAKQAEAMSEPEALQLVFAAGLSTASAVTNVSGRGVGMDVVRTNVERVGGTIDVHTDLGRGTTIQVRIPLTVPLVPHDDDLLVVPALDCDHVRSSLRHSGVAE